MFPVCKAAFLYCSIRLRILFCFILKEKYTLCFVGF